MYKRMVVLLDGSELAEVVFEYAQELSGRLHIDAELLHVCSPHEADQVPMRRAYMEHMAAQLCSKAEEIRLKYSEAAADQCIQARGHVVVGYPAEEILRYIDENDVDLVMMSTHGSSGFRGWDIGGVANKVIHASDAPVWLVPAELREEIIADTLPERTLVVPLSGSQQSESALPHALGLLEQRGAEGGLTLIHAYDPENITLTRAALLEGEQARTKMKDYLESVAKPIRERGLDVQTVVLTGEPAATIINYLRENPAQLLVMATRGHRGLTKMVFGSVTENIIHMVKKTPLLLVGGED